MGVAMVNHHIDFRFISLITAEQAHSLKVIPLERRENKLVCLSPNNDQKQLNILRLVLGEEIAIEAID